MRALKIMALAGATALALGVAGQASATDYTVPLTAGSGVLTGSFGSTVSGDNFMDSFTFALPSSASGSSFTLSSSSITSTSVITGLTAYLDNVANQFSVTQFVDPTDNTVTYDFGRYNGGALASGNHTIYVSGSTGTASISGTVVARLAPPTGAVPEPASWAMMIGGVGFVGGAMRRRVKRTANGVAFA